MNSAMSHFGRDVSKLTDYYYRKLMSLPTNVILAILLIIDALFPALIRTYITSNILYIASYLSGVIAYLLTAYITWLGKPMSLRRVVGLVDFSLLLFLPLDIALVFTNYYCVAIAASSGFLLFIAFSILTSIRAIIAALAPPIIGSLISTLIFRDLRGFAILTEVSLVSFLIYMIYIILTTYMGKIHGFNPFELARGFLNVWLGGSPHIMDHIFESKSIERDVDIFLMRIDREGKKPILLVAPQIHFGPMRDVGSSAFPYIIEEEGAKRGIITLAFHTPGTHDMNLSSKNESIRCAKLCIEEGLRGIAKELFLRPQRHRHKHLESFTLYTNKSCLAIILSPEKGGDDMPAELWDFTKQVAKKALYKNIVIIDAHNFQGPRDFANIDDIKKLITHVSLYVSEGCENVAVGYGESKVRMYTEGLCSDVVKALCIRCGDKDYAIIYIYGNNITPNGRERIRREVLKLGFEDCEVITPDDHTCAATSLESTYITVKPSMYLIEAVRKAALASRKDLVSAKVMTKLIRIKARIAGPAVWKMLMLLDKVGNFILRTWIPLLIMSQVLLGIGLYMTKII